jgi:hypothetical protein
LFITSEHVAPLQPAASPLHTVTENAVGICTVNVTVLPKKVGTWHAKWPLPQSMLYAGPVPTKTSPLVGVSTVKSGKLVMFAVTEWSRSMVRLQLPEPLQSPDQLARAKLSASRSPAIEGTREIAWPGSKVTAQPVLVTVVLPFGKSALHMRLAPLNMSLTMTSAVGRPSGSTFMVRFSTGFFA